VPGRERQRMLSGGGGDEHVRMITNITTNMCGTLSPEGSAQRSVRPVRFASR
jgi:hypothetical protein